jgi:hypothetical protein
MWNAKAWGGVSSADGASGGVSALTWRGAKARAPMDTPAATAPLVHPRARVSILVMAIIYREVI